MHVRTYVFTYVCVLMYTTVYIYVHTYVGLLLTVVVVVQTGHQICLLGKCVYVCTCAHTGVRQALKVFIKSNY